MMKPQFIIFLILFQLFFCFTTSYSQTNSDSIIFLAEDMNDYEIFDKLTLYNDSSFIYYRDRRYICGFKDSTSGVYSWKNKKIELNSYDCFRSHIVVKDSVRESQNLIYFNLDFFYSYLIEIDENHTESKDTLFFWTHNIEGETPKIYHYRESNKKNIIGFKVFQDNQFCGEYYFKNKESNTFIINIIPPSRYDVFYIEDCYIISIEENMDKISLVGNGLPIIFRRNSPFYRKPLFKKY